MPTFQLSEPWRLNGFIKQYRKPRKTSHKKITSNHRKKSIEEHNADNQPSPHLTCKVINSYKKELFEKKLLSPHK